MAPGYFASVNSHFTAKTMTNTVASIAVAIVIFVSAYFATKKVREEKQLNKAKIPKPVRDWRPVVRRASDEFDVPYNYAHAILWKESLGDPGARGGAGEIGLMQLKPIAVKDVQQVKGDFSGWKHDPEQNIRAGVAYLKRQFERTGDWREAIKAYNQGFAGMKENPHKATAYLEDIEQKAKFFV